VITGNDYREAIQNPHINLADDELQQGIPVRDGLGLPRAVSGNFASVFTIVCGQRRYAVKCFFNTFEDQLRRYQAIHEYLHSVERPWEVEFEFQPKGIRIAGTWQPIVKMEWIDATRLDRYVFDRLNDHVALLELANEFAALVGDLKECGIAHGDLQHGNILVTSTGELRLVDYDGMYVPALQGLGSHELGHPNYQHPARSDKDFDSYLDNFSAWVIYVSLVALSVDPSIWGRVTAGEEQLVFNRQDFEATIYSPGFGALQMTGDPQLGELATEMKQMLTHGLRSVPDLVPIDVELPATAGVVFTPSSAQLPEQAAAVTALPGWMSAAEPARSDELNVEAGLKWMVGQLPSLPQIRFTTTGVASKRLIRALGLIILLLAVLGVTQVLTVASTVTLGVVSVTLVASAEALLYRRTPEGTQRRQVRRSLARQRDAVRNSARQLDKLLSDADDLDSREKKELEKIDAEAKRIREKEQDQLQSAQRKLQSKLDDVARRRLGLQQDEQRERAEALKQLQGRQYQAELARHSVNELRLSAAIKAGLKYYNMYSAADIRGSSGEYVVRADGALLKVRGVGPAKARTIHMWAIDMQNRARMSMPQTLPAADSAQIQQKFGARLQALGVEEQSVRHAAQSEVEGIRSISQQQGLQVVAKGNALRVTNTQKRQSQHLSITAAKRNFLDEQWKEAQSTREAEAYSEITFPRFLARAALVR
jgi:hypothetical protein